MTESSVVNAWIAEGMAEGEAGGSRTFLVRIGAKKFGHYPTAEQRNALDAITDLALLTQLIERSTTKPPSRWSVATGLSLWKV